MKRPTTILGLNAWHPDSSACLVVDGELVAAVEEERFRRIKHWSGFPAQAVRWCLSEAGLDASDLDWVAINRDPKAGLGHKLRHVLSKRPSARMLRDRLANARQVGGVRQSLAETLGLPMDQLAFQTSRVEHHRAHLASSFLVSPFEQAAVVSVDGFGDFASSAWGVGRGSTLTIDGRVRFPHSLGLLYLAVTQLLGFPRYGDEYKVMGMAAYGSPTRLDDVRKLVRLLPNGTFELELRYFRHHSEGVEMRWDGGAPDVGRAYSPEMEALLGAARDPEQELTQGHFDLAASLQACYEEALFHLLRAVAKETGQRALCLSGGCAMNGLANGRILEETPFDELYIPPAPGDAGGAIGAALDVWCGRLGRERVYRMQHAYVGPGFAPRAVADAVAEARMDLDRSACSVRRVEDQGELCRQTAERIAAGCVVGWFQDRMEWGPRALGNRSILADPRRADVRELLNAKIKLRELFRPFAPSVLAEDVGQWFDRDGEVPFMLEIRNVRGDRRKEIPAVTHVDGTGRLQTVGRETNPLYHRLIQSFQDATGVPIVLNTSFNENEPIVCRPEEALHCFLRTKMDVLVLGDHVIERQVA